MNLVWKRVISDAISLVDRRKSGTYLHHDPLHPSSLVVCLISNSCCLRKFYNSIEKKQMVCKHDYQSTWDQEYIKVFFLPFHLLSDHQIALTKVCVLNL
ncbi:hypothetical protein AQUCO_05100064v1 [Aquilegia coerulea]|uniref:Uncharacterized protein n=1 Tax=Aquilegia coerulea TaxID=218851 RepID=A0A2G5CJ15_AQUCA|nr:hypothetical protein AQUCO_05100064v1 [Aquilegia coerulea]